MAGIKCLLLAIAVASVSAEFAKHQENDDRTRIVNGFNATTGQFPHQVSLRLTSGFRYHFCGASIINSRWLLTAAHCVVKQTPNSFNAVVGSITIKPSGTSYNISLIIPHPNYVSGVLANDIALLQIIGEIRFSDVVKPIALPTKNTLPHTPVKLSGWGRTRTTSRPNILQYMDSITISPNECKQRLHGQDIDDFEKILCHQSKRLAGACMGDSGKKTHIFI